jgi:hypothetical protein
MPVHSFKCIASVVLLFWNSSKIKMAAGGRLDFGSLHNVSTINGNLTLNKMTPVWRKSVKGFWSYCIHCVLASYHFMDVKMTGCKTQMQLEFWAILRRSGVDISNGLNVIAFSNVSLQKFKMAASGQSGRIFRRRLADRFPLSRLKRYICAKGDICSICSFVTIHFVTYIQTSIHPDIHPSTA